MVEHILDVLRIPILWFIVTDVKIKDFWEKLTPFILICADEELQPAGH